MKVRIYTNYFGDYYRFMLNAMRRSIEANFPQAEFVVEELDDIPANKWLPVFVTSNDWKMEYWARHIEESKDGEYVVLMDCDTLVLRPLNSAFSTTFDFGYTVRPGKIPFNSGVTFIRVNPRTKAFMRQWADDNHAIVKKGSAALPLLQEYAGPNQSCLKRLLDRYASSPNGIRISTLPCRIYNCEQETYKEFDPEQTCVLHVKSWLREMLLNNAPQSAGTEAERALMAVCREYGY